MKLTAPIQKLFAHAREVYDALLKQEATAVNTALYFGAILCEIKEQVGHGEFIVARKEQFPDLSDDRAERWMKAAANVIAQVKLPTLDVPVSRLLSASAEDLPDDAARDAQQLLFEFTKDKTIKECLAAVVVDGDEPHRITRAANGKKHGGTKGEDRKNWPQFIGEKLTDIAAHLKSWKSFTPVQVEATHAKFDGWIAKAPTALLTHLKQRINEELKGR